MPTWSRLTESCVLPDMRSTGSARTNWSATALNRGSPISSRNFSDCIASGADPRASRQGTVQASFLTRPFEPVSVLAVEKPPGNGLRRPETNGVLRPSGDHEISSEAGHSILAPQKRPEIKDVSTLLTKP